MNTDQDLEKRELVSCQLCGRPLIRRTREAATCRECQEREGRLHGET